VTCFSSITGPDDREFADASISYRWRNSAKVMFSGKPVNNALLDESKQNQPRLYVTLQAFWYFHVKSTIVTSLTKILHFYWSNLSHITLDILAISLAEAQLLDIINQMFDIL